MINVLGVRKLSDSNNAIVTWKVAVPALTVIALIITAFHGSNFTSGSSGGFMPFGWKGVLTALPLGVVFSLTGFEQAVQMGGESRNPGRDMPRAVIGSVLIGIVLYLALQVAFIGSLSPSALAHGWADPIGKGDFGPFATLATTLGLGWLAVFALHRCRGQPRRHRSDLYRHELAGGLHDVAQWLRAQEAVQDRQARCPVREHRVVVLRRAHHVSPISRLAEAGLVHHVRLGLDVRVCSDLASGPASQ